MPLALKTGDSHLVQDQDSVEEALFVFHLKDLIRIYVWAAVFGLRYHATRRCHCLAYFDSYWIACLNVIHVSQLIVFPGCWNSIKKNTVLITKNNTVDFLCHMSFGIFWCWKRWKLPLHQMLFSLRCVMTHPCLTPYQTVHLLVQCLDSKQFQHIPFSFVCAHKLIFWACKMHKPFDILNVL